MRGSKDSVSLDSIYLHFFPVYFSMFSEIIFQITCNNITEMEKVAMDIDVNTSSIEDVLNDDCIQEIFRRINSIPDYLNAALTCTRFLKNAKVCFPFKYIIIFHTRVLSRIIYLTELHGTKLDPLEVPWDVVPGFLHAFGPFIKSIYFYPSTYPNNRFQNDIIFNKIAEYCGKTLLELKLTEVI